MHIYNMHDAKTQLSQLVKKAQLGETVVIARGGVPAVTVVPYKPPKSKKPRLLGQLKGKIYIAPDFDEIPEDFADYV